jgi:amidase
MRRNELQTAYAEQWNAAGIDAIICPVAPTVASAHGESLYWGYTSAFNILDYSCVVFPVGTVVESDTWVNFPPESNEAMSELDAIFRDFYTGPEKYKDAPVALQLVNRRLREEQALGISTVILSCLK